MPFSVDLLPDLPVVVFVQSGANVAAEAADALGRLIPMLDALPEKGYLVMDVRALTIGLDDLPATASLAALKPNALLHHPNLYETLIISGDTLIKLAAQGMRTATFGNVNLKVFATPEGALDYCREQIAVAASQGRESKSKAG